MSDPKTSLTIPTSFKRFTLQVKAIRKEKFVILHFDYQFAYTIFTTTDSTIMLHTTAYLSHTTSKLRTVTSDVWTISNAHSRTHEMTPAGDVADLSERWPGFNHMCDLWWIKWHWDRSFSFRVFRSFPVSINHQRSMFIHSSLNLYNLSK